MSFKLSNRSRGNLEGVDVGLNRGCRLRYCRHKN
jgi:hypothetical protein